MKKLVIITGGTGDLGQSIIEKFYHNDYLVYFTYLGNYDKSRMIEEKYPATTAVKVDVRDYNQVKDFIDQIYVTHGRIDCLVNNAGINKDKTITFMNQRSWQDVINTNLNGTFNCCKFVSKYMINQGNGSIINMSSVSGMKGIEGQTNYSAAKAGINGLTKTLAKEMAKYNVRVNAICPGFIKSDMTSNLDESRLVNMIPMQHLGNPDDVSELALFLSENRSKYITGQMITVDGGLSI
ncbi:3-oxoacyl-ACP reductase FabG [Bacillus atrophaeus]|uniref:3-oxoacyl-(Acyl-carrier-protein) reductase n=2 Tax=Bacillus atrophaeus TaxID=1452 RepID=A0ABM5LTX5_BACA1|nr:3-oxoacyl-ACP reductase FabG [Bacillus atrophaeus]AMR63849.1 3-oxoacyl-ACP reductase [Bacillus subtilis subsp. globigii]ADP31147.1 3-oxoacyl-(acyl-carrier-protein) reductase [Bacillus atrophaeus 1942]AIK47769.1 3-beta hydroxysteroid dehydrogenase/isomerase family protein [Bacillus atrophaeus subsp. globigii]EIM09337.1 3-oxoacyl-ACP reductase [Bacillus atrophaeus C89]KFK81264.1 3-beta hydroxysteroid dehydrogenase/isomerase family protein [Bacillus atrophaeus]